MLYQAASYLTDRASDGVRSFLTLIKDNVNLFNVQQSKEWESRIFGVTKTLFDNADKDTPEFGKAELDFIAKEPYKEGEEQLRDNYRSVKLPLEVVEEPKGEEPKDEDPTGEEPKGEDPKGEDPKGEDPKGEDPKGEDPKGEEPKGEDPKGDEPGGGME